MSFNQSFAAIVLAFTIIIGLAALHNWANSDDED